MFTSTTGIVRLSFLVVKNESHYFRIITTILLQNLAIFFYSQVHTDRSQFDVVIKATGPQKQEMIWVPAIDTRTYCKLDYTYWPWDVQNCRYSIGSWTKFGDQLDVGMLRNVMLNELLR